MNFPIFINKWVISNRFINRTPFWFWFRLINHDGWRMDDHVRYWDFWNSINQGIIDMNYQWEFEKFWGKGTKPEKIYLSPENFDALQKRLSEPPDPEQIESLRKLMTRKAPWED